MLIGHQINAAITSPAKVHQAPAHRKTSNPRPVVHTSTHLAAARFIFASFLALFFPPAVRGDAGGGRTALFGGVLTPLPEMSFGADFSVSGLLAADGLLGVGGLLTVFGLLAASTASSPSAFTSAFRCASHTVDAEPSATRETYAKRQRSLGALDRRDERGCCSSFA